MISALPSARAGGSRYCPIRLFKRAEILLAMLAAGRASADMARIFRVHRATASRVASDTRRNRTAGAPIDIKKLTRS
jgi:hypothetical protein